MFGLLFQLVLGAWRPAAGPPNRLAPHEVHCQSLLASLTNRDDHDALARFLALEILVNHEVLKPEVAWVPSSRHYRRPR